MNPIKIPEMVLIDVDGTMVNSVPDLAYSIDQMMLDLDMPVRGEDKVRHWVGNGIERLVKRALMFAPREPPDSRLSAPATAITTVKIFVDMSLML